MTSFFSSVYFFVVAVIHERSGPPYSNQQMLIRSNSLIPRKVTHIPDLPKTGNNSFNKTDLISKAGINPPSLS